MYLYRSLNEYDFSKLNNGNNLDAQKKSSDFSNDQLLKNGIDHIFAGSNASQQGCWISTSKDFYKNCKEYAIPQLGGYNTGSSRKNIAVIDFKYWKNFDPSDPIKNCTIFKGINNNVIVNFSNQKEFPYVPKQKGKMRYVNNEAWNNERLSNKIKDIRNKIIANTPITGAFDCSMQKQGSYLPLVQEMSIYTMCNMGSTGLSETMIPGANGSCMSKGPAVAAAEVLILNSIPNHAIKYILTPQLQDILYSVAPDKLDFILDMLIAKELVFEFKDDTICINCKGKTITIYSQDAVLLGNLYVDYLLKNKGIYSKEDVADYLQRKQLLIKTILDECHVLMRLDISKSEGLSIIEREGLIFYDFDTEKEPLVLYKNQKQKPDLISFKQNNIIFTYADKASIDQKIKELIEENRIEEK